MGTFQKLHSAPTRIQSVDLLRGAVMVIMAIDHVRAYSGLPAGSFSPGVYFGRWITHYSAPSFAFLLVGIPEDQRWGLSWLYLVWFIDVILLYFSCRWYARYKAKHPEKGWLKYL